MEKKETNEKIANVLELLREVINTINNENISLDEETVTRKNNEIEQSIIEIVKMLGQSPSNKSISDIQNPPTEPIHSADIAIVTVDPLKVYFGDNGMTDEHLVELLQTTLKTRAIKPSLMKHIRNQYMESGNALFESKLWSKNSATINEKLKDMVGRGIEIIEGRVKSLYGKNKKVTKILYLFKLEAETDKFSCKRSPDS